MYYIALRTLQQYLYCAKRWGLIELNCEWEENSFVVMGNLLHKNVDNPFLQTSDGNKKIERAVPVFNHQLKLVGKVDQLEFVHSQGGSYVEKYKDKYKVTIVEYKNSKPSKSDYHLEDAVQIYAQKICVDEMFSCDCSACIYYGDTKRRIKIEFSDEIKESFDHAYNQILHAIESNIIPSIRENQYCGGCSLRDLCIPKAYMIEKKYKDFILKANEKNT